MHLTLMTIIYINSTSNNPTDMLFHAIIDRDYIHALTNKCVHTCRHARKDTEGHRCARMGVEWCRVVVRCVCDAETGRGGHGIHGGAHLHVHVMEAKRAQKRIANCHEGVQVRFVRSLGHVWGLTGADRCIGADGMRRTAQRGTEGHGQAHLCWHA